MVLFRYLEKKNNLLDRNTSVSKELPIPVAIAALYNANVFYPQSRDTSYVTYVRKGHGLVRTTLVDLRRGQLAVRTRMWFERLYI